MKLSRIATGAGAALAGLAAHDLLQQRHSLLRAFPVLGHARYLIEMLGPELRQYIVAANDEERPFTRDQRRYIYASSKGVSYTVDHHGQGLEATMIEIRHDEILEPDGIELWADRLARCLTIARTVVRGTPGTPA